MAGRAQAPVIGFIASGGARMDDGVAALGGYGKIFRATVALSGKVPQISVISGVSAGGGAYSPALTDFVVMTGESAMFLTGPGVVREVMGEDVDMPGLGGPKIHERNGVSQFSVEDDLAATVLVRELLGYFPQRAGDRPPPAPAGLAQEVVGEGRDEQKLRNMIRNAGLEDCVSILAWTSGLTSLYSAADMLLIPSCFEGVPLVMLEAMWHQLPVVASDVDGMAELLPSEWLFRSGDARSLVKTISRVRHAENSQFLVANRKRILEQFSVTLFQERFCEEVAGHLDSPPTNSGTDKLSADAIR